jgi:hypothetical protein
LINCLHWWIDPAVSDLRILLTPSQKAELANDAYGRRLLSWETQGRAVIVAADNLWEALPEQLQGEPSAILWVDGTKPWNGTYEGLRTGLALHRYHPADLVVSAASFSQLTEDAERQLQQRGSSSPPAETVDLSLGATFLSSRYLCWLNHPVFASVGRKESTDWSPSALLAASRILGWIVAATDHTVQAFDAAGDGGAAKAAVSTCNG